MFSIQQFVKALRKLQNSGSGNSVDLMAKNVKHVAASMSTTTTSTPAATTPAAGNTAPAMATALPSLEGPISAEQHEQQQLLPMLSLLLPLLQQRPQTTDSSQQIQATCETSQHSTNISLDSHSLANSTNTVSADIGAESPSSTVAKTSTNAPNTHALGTTTAAAATNFIHLQQRSQQIQNFYQQHLHHFHTQHNHSLYAKQKQTQFAMSSLAAEPLTLKQDDAMNMNGSERGATPDAANGSKGESNASQQNNSASSTSGKPCYNAGMGQILQFMELIGNLKHTKRTGWVLRDVNDCESISGHMYRMSMMTFLLDGTEGLNQIRCMELALVHDLAESLVGDITPFCGVSKVEKRAMEFKAMEDICKLIEPRGKRIMELFEEYETGESAESKFVKDLDRLDMVMQAFEYEKRDNCLLRHQEFFDSTAGKFQHPFVQKLVDEIYEQRRNLAIAKGATPPPPVHVPDMEAESLTNGHSVDAANAALEEQKSKSTSSS